MGHDPADGSDRWWVGIMCTASTTPVVGDGRLYAATYMMGGEEDERVTLPTFDQLLEKYDTNKDGQLSFQEFLAAAPGLRPNESPDDLLRKLDTNHDGKISADEFRAPELAKFNRVDANHDGIVTPDEIKAANTRK